MTGPLRKLRYLEYLLLMAPGVVLVVMATGLMLNGKTGPFEAVGLLLGLGLVVWQFLKFSKALRRDIGNFIVLKSETGSIRVHASAIEEALRRTAKSLPEVYDIRVKLVIDNQTRVPTAGEVDARIRDITNILAVHDTLSRVLAERYEQILPSVPSIEFHLTIKHQEKPPSKPKRRERKIVPPEEDETKAIRAPQYPIPKK